VGSVWDSSKCLRCHSAVDSKLANQIAVVRGANNTTVSP
jgi:hypothetical protein